MNALRFRPARDAREVDEAYALEALVFGPDPASARARREANDRLEPPAPEDVFLALDGSRVVGLVRFMRRRLRVGRKSLDAGGVTHVCVAPDLRGKGAGRSLMEAALRELRRRGYPLSATIARRAVDGFYPIFGYVGVDAFCELRLSAGAAGKPALRAEPGPKPERARLYAELYRRAYSGQPLSFERDARWWDRLGERLRLKHPSLCWIDLLRAGRVVGYAARDDRGVWEAASLPADASACLDALAAGGELVSRLAPAHPWTLAARARNHTFSTRAAWDGGHLVCVLDAAAFTAALSPRAPHAAKDPRAFLARCILARDLRPVWGPLDEF